MVNWTQSGNVQTFMDVFQESLISWNPKKWKIFQMILLTIL